MKVLILDTFHESLQLKLEENGHECLNMSNSPDSEVLLAMPFAEILVLRSRMSIRQEQIDACPNLKIIGRVGAGLEHIDVDYARSRGVKVLSSPEGNRQAVAEHAIGMLLTLFNNIAKSNNEVRDGLWMRKENGGVELAGKTIGILDMEIQALLLPKCSQVLELRCWPLINTKRVLSLNREWTRFLVKQIL